MRGDLLDSEALLAPTAAGNAELNRPANSLSVPQRKLLLLIHKGINYRTLMESGPSADRDRRDRDLSRLFELGLAGHVDADNNSAPTYIAGPLTQFGPATGVCPAPSPESARTAPPPPVTAPAVGAAKEPLMALCAVAGALLVGGLLWLALRGGDESPALIRSTPAPTVAMTASAAPAPPALAVTITDANSATPVSLPATASAPIVPARTGQKVAEPRRVSVTPLAAKKESVPAAAANAGMATLPTPRGESPDTTATPVASSFSPSVAALPTVPTAGGRVLEAAPAVNSAPKRSAPNKTPLSAPAPVSLAPTVTSAPPTAATVIASAAAPRIFMRVNPDFPVEAARAGVTAGTVRARMRVGADGSVAAVEILQSNPMRIFDRAVTRALSQWKYEPTGQPRTVDFEVEFRLEGT